METRQENFDREQNFDAEIVDERAQEAFHWFTRFATERLAFAIRYPGNMRRNAHTENDQVVFMTTNEVSWWVAYVGQYEVTRCIRAAQHSMQNDEYFKNVREILERSKLYSTPPDNIT